MAIYLLVLRSVLYDAVIDFSSAMNDADVPRSFPVRLSAQIARWPVAKRLGLRRRLHALIEATVARQVETQGLHAARLFCARRIALYARIAPGIRLTIWREVLNRMRDHETSA